MNNISYSNPISINVRSSCNGERKSHVIVDNDQFETIKNSLYFMFNEITALIFIILNQPNTSNVFPLAASPYMNCIPFHKE